MSDLLYFSHKYKSTIKTYFKTYFCATNSQPASKWNSDFHGNMDDFYGLFSVSFIILCTHKYEEILSKHFPFYHQNYGLLLTLSLAEIMQLFSRPIIRFILTKGRIVHCISCAYCVVSVSVYCLQKGTSIENSDLSIGSTETKYIKLSTKTQNYFNNIQLLCTL